MSFDPNTDADFQKFLDTHVIVIPVGFPAKTAVVDGSRPLWRIAQDISAEWPNPYFGAVPYIEALRDLDKITDSYGEDPARMIVAYFLSNSATWKGPRAKELKNELRRLIGQKEAK